VLAADFEDTTVGEVAVAAGLQVFQDLLPQCLEPVGGRQLHEALPETFGVGAEAMLFQQLFALPVEPFQLDRTLQFFAGGFLQGIHVTPRQCRALGVKAGQQALRTVHFLFENLFQRFLHGNLPRVRQCLFQADQFLGDTLGVDGKGALFNRAAHCLHALAVDHRLAFEPAFKRAQLVRQAGQTDPVGAAAAGGEWCILTPGCSMPVINRCTLAADVRGNGCYPVVFNFHFELLKVKAYSAYDINIVTAFNNFRRFFWRFP